MTTSGTKSNNEWQRVATGSTTSDNEWHNEWQRVAMSENKWQRVVQQMKTSGTRNESEREEF